MDDWIDKHIRIVRLIPWCVGSLGVFLVVKHTYMFTKFRSASSIPDKLISSNHVLSGRVVKCSNDSLGVWHVPLGHRLLRWKTRPQLNKDDISSDLINIQLTGISLQQEVTNSWLENQLTNQMIRFVPTSRSEDGTCLECLIYKPFKYSLGGTTINELLLKEGVATIKESTGSHGDQDHTPFLTRLTNNEALAKKRGRGLWAGSEFESWRWRFWKKFKKLIFRK